MTKGDVVAIVLAEVTGHHKAIVGELLTAFKDNFEGTQNFDDEMAGAEADALLADLMQEKEGLRAWLIKGGLM